MALNPDYGETVGLSGAAGTLGSSAAAVVPFVVTGNLDANYRESLTLTDGTSSTALADADAGGEPGNRNRRRRDHLYAERTECDGDRTGNTATLVLTEGSTHETFSFTPTATSGTYTETMNFGSAGTVTASMTLTNAVDNSFTATGTTSPSPRPPRRRRASASAQVLWM